MTPLRFQNPRIQRLRRLLGRRSARSDEGVFVIEGRKLLDEALRAAMPIECVFVSADTADLSIATVLERASGLGIDVVSVEAGVFERIADVIAPQSVCAIVRRHRWGLLNMTDGLLRGGFVAVGVDIRDPGNAGTLIRSAEASGAVGVVLCADSVDITSPKVVRSTAGALFHLPVVTDVSFEETLAFFRDNGVRSWATAVRPDRCVAYFDADLCGPTAVVFGNESHGLSEADLGAVDGLLTIPMLGHTESLNVAVSSAVVCFEAARQRATPESSLPTP